MGGGMGANMGGGHCGMGMGGGACGMGHSGAMMYPTMAPVAPKRQRMNAGGQQQVPMPVLKLRGVPYTASEVDVRAFFAGYELLDVLIVRNAEGRMSGEAFVLLPAHGQLQIAIAQLNRSNMGHRYIELFQATREDYYNAVATHVSTTPKAPAVGEFDTEGDVNLTSGPHPGQQGMGQMQSVINDSTTTIKLRGLPWSATPRDIVGFFANVAPIEESDIEVKLTAEGRSSGEAIAKFGDPTSAQAAMAMNHQSMGRRYIELFPVNG